MGWLASKHGLTELIDPIVLRAGTCQSDLRRAELKKTTPSESDSRWKNGRFPSPEPAPGPLEQDKAGV